MSVGDFIKKIHRAIARLRAALLNKKKRTHPCARWGNRNHFAATALSLMFTP